MDFAASDVSAAVVEQIAQAAQDAHTLCDDLAETVPREKNQSRRPMSHDRWRRTQNSAKVGLIVRWMRSYCDLPA